MRRLSMAFDGLKNVYLIEKQYTQLKSEYKDVSLMFLYENDIL